MGKVKKMIEKFNTKKIAKEHGRTYEQQIYRNDLAKELRDKRENRDF